MPDRPARWSGRAFRRHAEEDSRPPAPGAVCCHRAPTSGTGSCPCGGGRPRLGHDDLGPLSLVRGSCPPIAARAAGQPRRVGRGSGPAADPAPEGDGAASPGPDARVAGGADGPAGRGPPACGHCAGRPRARRRALRRSTGLRPPAEHRCPLGGGPPPARPGPATRPGLHRPDRHELAGHSEGTPGGGSSTRSTRSRPRTTSPSDPGRTSSRRSRRRGRRRRSRTGSPRGTAARGPGTRPWRSRWGGASPPAASRDHPTSGPGTRWTPRSRSPGGTDARPRRDGARRPRPVVEGTALPGARRVTGGGVTKGDGAVLRRTRAWMRALPSAGRMPTARPRSDWCRRPTSAPRTPGPDRGAPAPPGPGGRRLPVVHLQDAFRLDRSSARGTDLCVPDGGPPSALQVDRAEDTWPPSARTSCPGSPRRSSPRSPSSCCANSARIPCGCGRPGAPPSGRCCRAARSGADWTC